uniref:Uncharacterized protein n=1 Tax=Lactuca sativa TaxID=4236 RepID=A0A9R1UFZ8_LACSA|nr:hypothetical protein LSAT_V11C900484840 [Lactuca sativa]
MRQPTDLGFLMATDALPVAYGTSHVTFVHRANRKSDENLGFQFVIIVTKTAKKTGIVGNEEKGSWNLGLQELWESQSRGPYTLNTASVVTVRITIRRLREETES